MKLDNLVEIDEVSSFLAGTQAVAFQVASSKLDRYGQIASVLSRFNYSRIKRHDKGLLIRFLVKITGYSRQQVTRLIKRYYDTGQLRCHQKTTNGFKSRYSQADLRTLVQLDQLHDTPNGFMVKKLCERAYHEYGDRSYERLSRISVSHIYNFRKSKGYKKHRHHYEKTKSQRNVHIGERRKPRSKGRPGYIRIDTVHQGDLDGRKGVYHINAVDEVTQFEVIVSVEKISEHYLVPALNKLLDKFPFKIINFHSDNGSEYVNKTVAKLLSKLLIEFTKSRPRQSNDNALAEGKNAAVVRKIFGHSHIAQKHAKKLDEFNENVVFPYINFHRPCLFPTTVISDKGKQVKKYEYKNMKTPYEKLKSLPEAKQYLKAGISFKKLDDIAAKMTDNEAAELLQKERSSLFKQFHDRHKSRA